MILLVFAGICLPASAATTAITSAGVTGFVAPVTGATPITASSLTPGSAQYTVSSLTWSGSPSTYVASTAYTATVTLTAAAGYTFSTALTPTVNTGTAAAGAVSGSGTGNTLTFTVTFPTTAAATVTAAPAPTFVSISPSSGTFAGGTLVTITGTGFTGATAVTIGGATATNLTVVSNTEITATTPASTSAGAADVIIVTPGGSVTGSKAFTYTAPAPTFTSISPTSGTTAGGTSLTITGTGLTGATAVTIGGATATGLTVVSDTEITATSPAGTAGTANVVITAPGGTLTETGAFTFTGTTSVPTVTGVSPTYGPVSTGTSITITGTGFTGATAVTVGGTAVTSFTVVSDTEITATTPATSTAGQVDVLVTTPSGTSSSVLGDLYNFANTATTVPVPIFIASPISGTAPLEVTFTDESTGVPASWSWTFGDGNTSTLQNPTNTYVNDGTYTVSLTEENSLGTNTTTMTGYIVVGATTPVAAFTAAPTSGTAPLTVQFTDQSTGSPTTWEWSFGDGSAGSAQSPSHTYQTAGTYTVTLTATNSEGSSTNSATQTITVDSAEPATTVPTPVITTAPTFAVGAEATTSSVDNWLAQQNAEIPSVAPTKKSPGYDALAALIGCGAVAGIALRRRH